MQVYIKDKGVTNTFNFQHPLFFKVFFRVGVIFLIHTITPFIVYGAPLNEDQPSQASPQDIRLAVLDFRDEAQLPPFERALLADSVRGAALNTPFQVMTKENMIALLPPGQSLDDCIGECEVDIGRKLGAHYIITGMIGRLDGRLQLLIRLYETKEGNLKGQATLSANTVGELQPKVSKASVQLLEELTPNLPMMSAHTRTLLFIQFSPKNIQLKIDGYTVDKKLGRSVRGGVLLPIEPGRHTIEGSARGYSSKRKSIKILMNQPHQVNLKLRRQYHPKRCYGGGCLGDLFIYTKPAGATVYLNGRSTRKKTKPSAHNPRLGSLSLSVPAGKYWVSAKKAPYENAERLITVEGGETYNEFRHSPLVLTRRLGKIKITSKPSGAIVRINGEVVGHTPFTKSKMAVKPYWLELIAAGYQSREELIMVKGGRGWRGDWTLTPSTTELQLLIRYRGKKVSGASVWIDDQSMGETDERGNISLKNLAAGDRHIQVHHPLYLPQGFTLSLEAGKVIKRRVVLKGAFAKLTVLMPKDYEQNQDQNLERGQTSEDSKKQRPARVIWAGVDLGTPPLKNVRVPAGRHWLQVRPQDEEHLQPYRKRFTLNVGEHKVISASFDPYMAILRVKSKPSGARLSINGEELGRTPYRGKHPAQKHTLKVVSPGMPQFLSVIDLKRDGHQEMVDFYGRTTVNISCEPMHGRVTLNGALVGPSPQMLDVKPGEHRVGCELLGVGVDEPLRLSLGDQLTKRLMIRTEDLNAKRDKNIRLQWVGKTMLALGAIGMAASLGVWQGPMKDSMATRDLHAQSWIFETNSTQRNTFYQEWNRADQEARQYQSWAWWSFGVGAGLSLIGGGLWALTPSWESDQHHSLP